ncbi:hypothetical protein ACLB2K_006196 [Fragaria x ananassa]
MLPLRKEYSADTNIHFQNAMEGKKFTRGQQTSLGFCLLLVLFICLSCILLVCWNQQVNHIMVFIKRVYDSTIYPLSHELDPKEWRENYGEQDNQGIEVDDYSMMSAREKRTRRWMLDEKVYQARYQLNDVLSCPPQKCSS